MNVVLLGIQGSGKGTQAQLMAERYNLAIFEMGDEFRKLAEEDSDLGHKVNKYVKQGQLVPAEIVLQIVDKFLQDVPNDQAVIFDGIPRNRTQQATFDRLLKKWKRDFVVVNIQIPEEETIKRLLARKRHDDTPDVIKNRIKIFQKNTSPTIDAYRKYNKVVNIDGNQTIEKVAIEIAEKIDPYFHK
jgi:adenylate kinase